MTARIVIYHLAGPKSKQVEEFAVDAFAEITIGRDPSSVIRFEAQEAEGVGSRHSRIRIVGDPPRFLLGDCGSANGTFLNGMIVDSESEVFPGDEIELGRNGPKFILDWAAGPTGASSRKITLPSAEAGTRNALVAVRAIAPMPADESAPHQSAAGSLVVQAHAPVSRSTNRAVVYGFLSLLMLIGMATGVAYRMHGPASAAREAGPGDMSPATASLPAGSAQPPPTSTPSRPDQSATDADSGLRADPPDAGTPSPPVPLEPRVALLPPQAIPADQPPNLSSTGGPEAASDRKPDLAGTVRKIAGASRFQVEGRWIELYGVDDPTTSGEHNQAVYEYLKPFAGIVRCYGRGAGKFECFGGGKDLAGVAIRRGLVRLTPEAPDEYDALMRRRAAER